MEERKAIVEPNMNWRIWRRGIPLAATTPGATPDREAAVEELRLAIERMDATDAIVNPGARRGREQAVVAIARALAATTPEGEDG